MTGFVSVTCDAVVAVEAPVALTFADVVEPDVVVVVVPWVKLTNKVKVPPPWIPTTSVEGFEFCEVTAA